MRLPIDEGKSIGLTIDEQGIPIDEGKCKGLTIDEQGMPIVEGMKQAQSSRSLCFHFKNHQSLLINRQSIPPVPTLQQSPILTHQSSIDSSCPNFNNHQSLLINRQSLLPTQTSIPKSPFLILSRQSILLWKNPSTS